MCLVLFPPFGFSALRYYFYGTRKRIFFGFGFRAEWARVRTIVHETTDVASA